VCCCTPAIFRLARKNMTPRAAAEHEVTALLGERLRPYFPETEVDHPGIWGEMVFQRLRKAIGTGDRVAVSVACDLIEKDPKLPFGKLIKSGLSRQLRKSPQFLVASERAQQQVAASRRMLRASGLQR
jgi:hypothetical protein